MKHNNKIFSRLLLLVGISLLTTATLFAQSDQGRIVGNVSDANGAALPNATVVVTNEKTGETRTVTTNTEGGYTITALRPSFYTIKIAGGGFAPTESKNVQISVGQELKFDVALQIEGATARVDVV
jgi:hypothetical protein